MTAHVGIARSAARAGAAGIVAAALAATAFAAPAHAEQAGERGHPAARQAMEAIVAGGIPGVVAAESVRGGSWKDHAGVGNRTTGKPRDVNDRFRIASITKTFVATVLLKLEAEGKLDLDDTVEKHLPGVVRGHGNDGRKITVRQLLNHTSGLFDYLADEEYVKKYLLAPGFLKHRYDTIPPEYHVGVAMGHAPLFEPGAKHSYSNTNYILAGLIIEKVTGSAYERAVRERIIEPLGLTSTSQPGNSVHLPKPSSRAYSSLYDFTTPAPRIYDVTRMNGSQGWADGDIISTTGDLNRFFRALLGGKVLPPAQLRAMKTVVPAGDLGEGGGYGLGVYTYKTSCGTKVWGHSGGIVGSVSEVVTTENGRRAVASNQNGDWSRAASVTDAAFCGNTAAKARKIY
ncbi:serine hydrolase domain-containing protein [Streptomyces sp. CAU 1734]|uniref:serine hydrolase domain-containing protein n=1 Tax=Streptomyces sp. CAU 1734 TaxID=3140360 RepID=UPI003261063F